MKFTKSIFWEIALRAGVALGYPSFAVSLKPRGGRLRTGAGKRNEARDAPRPGHGAAMGAIRHLAHSVVL